VAALRRIATVEAVSRFRETAPEGFRDQPMFLNAVVRISTRLTPSALLAKTREAERSLGRRPSFRNGPRVIDIDLLDVGGIRVRTDRLTLPHPRLSRRRFVLEPLAEVSDGWRHPISGRSAPELLRRLRKPLS
jgi:2-amino-4-hydroxy-6-hydroxymethyldihydropteridine diphosphokinase